MKIDHFSWIAPIYARVSYSKTDILREVASLPVDGYLLDAGGGTGRVSMAIRGLVREAIVADISLGMLQQARRQLLTPVCVLTEALPFPDESFDRVLMVDALHHVIDQVGTARDIFRVVKPGGLLVIEEPDIGTCGVKLIALAEKILLMRSHFLSPGEIAGLFEVENTQIRSDEGTAWVVIEKRADG